MFTIYRKAARVLVWLGPEAPNTALALEAIRRYHEGENIDVAKPVSVYLDGDTPEPGSIPDHVSEDSEGERVDDEMWEDTDSEECSYGELPQEARSYTAPSANPLVPNIDGSLRREECPGAPPAMMALVENRSQDVEIWEDTGSEARSYTRPSANPFVFNIAGSLRHREPPGAPPSMMMLDENPFQDDELVGLGDLCCRPCARRVWIQQEVFAAKELRIYCGQHELDFPTYREAARVTGAIHHDQRRIREDGRHEIIRRSTRAIARMRSQDPVELTKLEISRFRKTYQDNNSSVDRFELQPGREFERVLRYARYLEASDSRDYVYASLGCTDCPTWAPSTGTMDGGVQSQLLKPGIPIDYSRSIAEVFGDATIYVINLQRDLQILEDHTPMKSSRAGCQLPSWTVDWTANLFGPVWRHGSIVRRRTRLLELQSALHDGTIRFSGHRLGTVVSVEHRRTITITTHLVLNAVNSHGDPALAFSKSGSITTVCTTQKEFQLPVSSLWSEDQESNLNEPWIPLALLKRAQPGDMIVGIYGTPRAMICLRPSSSGRFSFVCLYDAEQGLYALLGPQWFRLRD
ncbi:Uu.00g117180.m01.CDS01 [Anthostomella pinea]|uniref:Uu.00g117180.m01.CDS01 n=1 Tax=Anthostomella pinea TaxID=933095 RepID=A0AAI8VG52_9PEZI|nr:Uu.00g117180.m01.CDS01 [Anthostomella pinea]